MAELKLTRVPGDRKLYELPGVGTLRVAGWLSGSATAEAGSQRWELSRRGVFHSAMLATDAAGATAGEFKGRSLRRRGGALRWGESELELRSSSFWRERYALAEGDRELATIEGKGWGKRPVAVSVEDGARIEPGLLLFAVYVVNALAEDASSGS